MKSAYILTYPDPATTDDLAEYIHYAIDISRYENSWYWYRVVIDGVLMLQFMIEDPDMAIQFRLRFG